MKCTRETPLDIVQSTELTTCHTPDPGPTRLANPNRSPGRDTIYTIYCILYCTGTLIDLFFLRADTCTCSIQTISVITKIIYIYKRTTTGVVSLKKIHTHIKSPIYLYMYIFYYKTSEIAETALESTYL